MITVPSRISTLISTLELGGIPTREELRRIATLQALDVVKLGEDFVTQACVQEERRTQAFDVES